VTKPPIEWEHPEKCHAHNRGGKQCGRNPIPGGVVCVMHGGKAPAVKAAAEQRLRTQAIEKDAAAVIAHEGIDNVEDPLDELSKLAAAATAMCDALGARVNALDNLTGSDHNGDEKIYAEVLLYERAMDRAARFLDLLVKAGFMERQVRIQEGTANAVVHVLQRIFERLNLTPEQAAQIPTIVPEELRALEG